MCYYKWWEKKIACFSGPLRKPQPEMSSLKRTNATSFSVRPEPFVEFSNTAIREFIKDFLQVFFLQIYENCRKLTQLMAKKLISFVNLNIARISATSLPYLRAHSKIKRCLPNRWSKFYLSWYLLQITILGNFACAIDSVEEVRLVDTVDVWNSVKVLRWKIHLSESKEQFDESFFLAMKAHFHKHEESTCGKG